MCGPAAASAFCCTFPCCCRWPHAALPLQQLVVDRSLLCRLAPCGSSASSSGYFLFFCSVLLLPPSREHAVWCRCRGHGLRLGVGVHRPFSFLFVALAFPVVQPGDAAYRCADARADVRADAHTVAHAVVRSLRVLLPIALALLVTLGHLFFFFFFAQP